MQSSRGTVKTMLAFGAIYFIWGSTYLALKQALVSIPPFLLMGTRSVIAGIILYSWGRYRTGEQVQSFHWPSLIIIGTLFFLLGHGGLAWGQQRVTSGVAALLIAPEPIWIAAIEWMMIRDFRMGARGILGLLFGLAGIVVLINPMDAFGEGRVDLIGSTVIILAAISWSSGAVYLRVARLPKSPAITAGAELLIGGTLLILVSLATGESLRGGVTLTALLSLGYLIFFGSIIAFSSYVWLLKTTSATRVATHTYVNPIIAIALGWVFAHEEITTTIALTSVLIIGSVYFVLNDQMNRPGEHVVRRFSRQDAD